MEKKKKKKRRHEREKRNKTRQLKMRREERERKKRREENVNSKKLHQINFITVATSSGGDIGVIAREETKRNAWRAGRMHTKVVVVKNE